jgi:hypothetical protein
MVHMKIKKTLSVLLMVVFSAFVINILGIIFSGMPVLNANNEPGRVVLLSLIQSGLIAVVMGITIWMMIVWDAGDKIPPLVMLFLGVLGICPFLVQTADSLWLLQICRGIRFIPSKTVWDTTASIRSFLTYFSTGLLAVLYIGFGIAGLFTKRKSA